MIVYHYFFNKYKFLDTFSKDENKIIKKSLNWTLKKANMQQVEEKNQ